VVSLFPGIYEALVPSLPLKGEKKKKKQIIKISGKTSQCLAFCKRASSFVKSAFLSIRQKELSKLLLPKQCFSKNKEIYNTNYN
jgi:hypothetical protein